MEESLESLESSLTEKVIPSIQKIRKEILPAKITNEDELKKTQMSFYTPEIIMRRVLEVVERTSKDHVYEKREELIQDMRIISAAQFYTSHLKAAAVDPDYLNDNKTRGDLYNALAKIDTPLFDLSYILIDKVEYIGSEDKEPKKNKRERALLFHFEESP